MCSDIGTTSRVCAMYSFTGILFTVSTASYHPSCVIGGAKRCSRLIGPRNGSSCVVCKSCWCPVAEIEIDVVLLGGGGAFEVASHQGNAFWGGEGWCDVGRIGVEWRTNGRSQRSSAVPSLPMFVLRVVWLSAFFQISSLSSPCCFNISSFPIIWTALRWSFANNTTLLHFGNRGRQRS